MRRQTANGGRPEIDKLDRRIAALTDWLSENAPYCEADQRHLDEHTTERAYWHYGYLAALRDARKLLAEAD